MRIKYRPHRGSLEESMALQKEFQSIEEMFKYIENESYSSISGIRLYRAEDLSIGESLGKDERIDWKETRYILTKRCGMVIYDTPQCIGMCSIEEE
jgi:hypothetical protein